MSIQIKEGSVILFQGDSITDCGRNCELDTMGNGYANMASAMYLANNPEAGVKFINRGISGNRVKDLQARWEEDCIVLKPDILSILIGINDTWRRYSVNDPTSVEAYKAGYRDILERTKAANPNIRIILCEPFVLPVKEGQDLWREDLDPKIQAVRKLALEYAVVYVPLDGVFAQACVQQNPSFWAADGVHPTPAGHALIAKAWLKAVTGVRG